MNIFTRELVELLHHRGKELSNLFGLHSPTYQLYPNKVVRLKRSLTEDLTATLNADDLELVARWLKLDPNGQEIQRLRAALLAELIRYQLGKRMDVALADELGEIVFQLLTGKDLRRLLLQRAELLSGVRGWDEVEGDQELDVEDEGDYLRGGFEGDRVRGLRDPVRGAIAEEEGPQIVSGDPTEGESEEMGLAAPPLEPALEAAVETYEQGTLWLEVARDTDNARVRQDYLIQARALLRRARNLAASISTGATKTKQELEWLAIIDAALKELPDTSAP